MHYCDHALSVVRLSVRPSVVNFSHFQLLLWNCWTEFNETWQESRSQRPLPSLCFSGRSEKQDGRPGLWLAEAFPTSPLKPLKGIQWNFTGSKISTSSTKFVFFGRIGKTRWPPWPLIGWDIFDFSSETAEPNSTKLGRKQDLNVLYQVCVFWADRKNKMAALASDWLRHIRLLLWNRWKEFNETWQEARSQRPLPSLCFSGRFEKQDGRPGLWLAETFSTSLKPLNGIQRNLTGSKISTSSTKFVFFGPIEKTRRPPWPLIGWDIFNFSSESAERNSTKLDRKQDLNVLYQVCVFRADQKKQDGRPGLWLAETFSTSSLKPLNGIQRNLTGSKISTSSTKFVFFGPNGKTRWPPWPLIGWDIFDFSSELLNGIQRNLTGRKISTSSTKFVFFEPIGKTRWPPWPLIGWDIFDFFSETAERNSKKLDRKQDLNVFYQVFFSGWWVNKNFRPGWSVKKAAHCTQVHDMWPFGPLVVMLLRHVAKDMTSLLLSWHKHYDFNAANVRRYKRNELEYLL